MILPDAIDKVSRALAFLRVERNDGSTGQGTAFVVAADGLLATAAHLLRDARKIEATIVGSKATLRCSIFASDAASDAALVKAEARDLKPVTLHRGDSVALGREVALMGFPHSDIFGELGQTPLGMTMRGIVGNRYRLGAVEYYVLDVSPSEGMSGGPVFLSDGGQVIGFVGGRFDPARTRAKMAGRPSEDVRSLPVERTSILFAPCIEYLLALMPARR
jgi:S1-C subfamily serine protease